MSAERTDMHRLQELVRLHRLGHKHRTVARLLGMSPNTERDYRQRLEPHGLLQGDPTALPELGELQDLIRSSRPLPSPSPSLLESFRPEIAELYARDKQPQAIYDELQQKYPQLKGKRSAIKRLCRRLKREAGIRPQDVRIPVQTEPGEVAQADFGYVGLLYVPQQDVPRKSWVFVLVLGYSRKMYARIVFDQSVPTWLQLHRQAFEAPGGVPKTLVPDNLKAAVIRAAFGADP